MSLLILASISIQVDHDGIRSISDGCTIRVYIVFVLMGRGQQYYSIVHYSTLDKTLVGPLADLIDPHYAHEVVLMIFDIN